MPVALSLNTIASARKPTFGRAGPLSTSAAVEIGDRGAPVAAEPNRVAGADRGPCPPGTRATRRRRGRPDGGGAGPHAADQQRSENDGAQFKESPHTAQCRRRSDHRALLRRLECSDDIAGTRLAIGRNHHEPCLSGGRSGPCVKCEGTLQHGREHPPWVTARSEPVRSSREDRHASAEPALDEKDPQSLPTSMTPPTSAFQGFDGDWTTTNWRSVSATLARDRFLDALIHRTGPYPRARGRADDATQSHSGREDRRDRLRVGDQRFILERQFRLGARFTSATTKAVRSRQSLTLAPPCSVIPRP